MYRFRGSQFLSVFLSFLMVLSVFTVFPGKAKADTLSILPNSGFEQVSGGKPLNWSVMSGTVTSSTYTVHSAVYSVQLTDNSSTASVGLRSQKLSVTLVKIMRLLCIPTMRRAARPFTWSFGMRVIHSSFSQLPRIIL